MLYTGNICEKYTFIYVDACIYEVGWYVFGYGIEKINLLYIFPPPELHTLMASLL
jgi:hypothetical protein